MFGFGEAREHQRGSGSLVDHDSRFLDRVRSDGKEAVNLLAIRVQNQGGMKIAVSNNQKPSPVQKALDLAGFQGLSREEARRRLGQEGANELPSLDKRGLLAIVFEVVKEPMFLMLMAANLSQSRADPPHARS
jgi:magnesium-transporting ATPase (P-type)